MNSKIEEIARNSPDVNENSIKLLIKKETKKI